MISAWLASHFAVIVKKKKTSTDSTEKTSLKKTLEYIVSYFTETKNPYSHSVYDLTR